LVAWCIHKAFAGNGFDAVRERLSQAPAWSLVALVATTLVSLVANGGLFWSLIRPVRRLPLLEVQMVNLLASFLNYVPVPFRLGLVARVAYHWRVDRLSALVISAWLFAALLSAGVAFAAVALAAPLARSWGLPATAGVAGIAAACGAMAVVLVARRRFVARLLRGAEPILADRWAFGGATALRLVDIAAWAGRMVAACVALDIGLSMQQAALLGVIAVVASMNPLGRFGFREAAVAWLGPLLLGGALPAAEIETTLAQLAIVESAAEGAVTVPLGALAALWCWRRWRNAPPKTPLPAGSV
jgi:uncharacterized membrane protein YbhN (UPF0104 family)